MYNKNGTPGRVRTCDLRLRSPLLYPAELPGRVLQLLYSIGTKGIITDRAFSFGAHSDERFGLL